MTDQSNQNLGDETVGFHYEKNAPNQLVVVTFEDAEQAQGLYDVLVEMDKKKTVNLSDAVFVFKNEAGEFEVDQKKHNEKKTGTVRGAFAGTLIGLVLGGPVLGLAGGALVGRLIAKKMDLGVDEGTIQSIANDLENGHTALFIYGTAQHAGPVVEAFKQFHGKIISTTIDPEKAERLQKALDQENSLS
jgi:uncharacterized membrane protein